MTDAPPKPTWDALKDLLRWAVTAFGQPSELAAELAVERRVGLLIRGWLCALEAYVRALLLMMAAEAPATNAPQRSWAAAPDGDPSKDETAGEPSAGELATVPDGEDADPAGSVRWAGVAFALSPPPRGCTGDWAGEPRRFLLTLRLAMRLEALIRVAEAPDRYARRLARRLRRDSRLAARVLREPHPSGCRSFPREEVGVALAHAWMAADVFAADTG